MSALVPGRRTGAAACAALALASIVVTGAGARVDGRAAAGLRFEIAFAPGARSEPVTGRVYVAISRDDQRPPIQEAGPTGVPLFGANVEALAPGRTAVIDASTFGHPLQSLRDLPPGDYWVQAFVNVYTKFARADGHTVWLHMDQWEGQDWRRSPGNLYSAPVKMHLDPQQDEPVGFVCDQVIPPVDLPPDTQYVKRFRIRSDILSKWWGQPIDLGATVLLPKGYDEHPDTRYPVNYIQGHFSTAAPGRFGSGGDFDQLWLADDPSTGSGSARASSRAGMPRFVYVTLQHPSPYYDDSYGVNSANNGPYGDAIMRELIPEVERRFRIIDQPWARQLSGGSTGGWIALAHQIFYPDFYGGTWASCPDSVDFRAHQIVDVYDDDNAYWLDMGWTKVERPDVRRPDGTVRSMMKDENWYELVVGDHSRSGGQWDIWEATYGPVGADGYPQRIWDKRGGAIDHEVAAYWKQSYDLRNILESKWATLGPMLAGKLHISIGDMDSYYLNNAVHLLADFLEKTTKPPYAGEVVFQPLAPHCWGPKPAELLQNMDAYVRRTAPAGADLSGWHY